jgi:NTP pyrophosphatase (non-canonical NTP hydrolase)
MNNETQKEVREFINQNELHISLSQRMLDLVSEAGELSKELLKSTNYGAKEWTKSDLGDEWEKEIGDLLFTLICIANLSDVDLQECLQKSLSKYKSRLYEKGHISSEE